MGVAHNIIPWFDVLGAFNDAPHNAQLHADSISAGGWIGAHSVPICVHLLEQSELLKQAFKSCMR